jgi:protocatechuate 3,4-dioxygenase, alpha subunit
MMAQADKILQETPSQTAGPYVHTGLAPWAIGLDVFKTDIGAEIAGPKSKGRRITVTGRIIDGAGDLVRDALIEVWQANSNGIYRHVEDPKFGELEKDFRGWGRAWTNFETGKWFFQTVKPGPIKDRDGVVHAPHLNIWIVARGINIGLSTRIYFADETDANANDPVLNMILPEQRRQTLLAKYRDEKLKTNDYVVDIALQGDHETVFLNT